MRDPALFSSVNCWTDADAILADKLVDFWRDRRELDQGEIASVFAKKSRGHEERAVKMVWDRLQAYPHNFELAAVRGTLDSLSSDGSLPKSSAPAPVRLRRLLLSGFHVNAADVQDILAGEILIRSECFFF